MPLRTASQRADQPRSCKRAAIAKQPMSKDSLPFRGDFTMCKDFTIKYVSHYMLIYRLSQISSHYVITYVIIVSS